MAKAKTETKTKAKTKTKARARARARANPGFDWTPWIYFAAGAAGAYAFSCYRRKAHVDQRRRMAMLQQRRQQAYPAPEAPQAPQLAHRPRHVPQPQQYAPVVAQPLQGHGHPRLPAPAESLGPPQHHPQQQQQQHQHQHQHQQPQLQRAPMSDQNGLPVGQDKVVELPEGQNGMTYVDPMPQSSFESYPGAGSVELQGF